MFSFIYESIKSDKKNDEDLFSLNPFESFNEFNFYSYDDINIDNEHSFPSIDYCHCCCCGRRNLNRYVENRQENNFTNNNNNNQSNNTNINNNTNSNSNNNINSNNNNTNSNNNNNEGMPNSSLFNFSDLTLTENSGFKPRKRKIKNIKNKLTKTKFVKSLNIDKDCCIICLQEFKNNQNIYKLSCNHIFHRRCLNKEIKFRQKCPICRKKF